MSVKFTGVEIKKFWTDPIWAEAYYDDGDWRLNGKSVNDDFEFDPSKVEDTDIVELLGGTVHDHDKYDELVEMARDWFKGKTTTTFVVVAPNDRASAIKDAIRAAGGTVV